MRLPAVFDIISFGYIGRVFVAIRLKDVNGIDSEFLDVLKINCT